MKKKKEIKICKHCDKKTTRLTISNPPVCVSCYGRLYKKRKNCEKCGREIRSGNICQKCSGYRRPTDKCSNCKEIKSVARRIDNKPYCRKCYNHLYRPKSICSSCKRTKIINSNGLCKSCYDAWKKKTDESYNIKKRLRDRVNRALRNYSKTGKIKTSDEYGINYKKIVEHIGECPGKIEDYHIDHIKALCNFNLDDPKQIKKAFAPENHQWLKKEDNLSKGKKSYEEWKNNKKVGEIDGNK